MSCPWVAVLTKVKVEELVLTKDSVPLVIRVTGFPLSITNSPYVVEVEVAKERFWSSVPVLSKYAKSKVSVRVVFSGNSCKIVPLKLAVMV